MLGIGMRACRHVSLCGRHTTFRASHAGRMLLLHKNASASLAFRLFSTTSNPSSLPQSTPERSRRAGFFSQEAKNSRARNSWFSWVFLLIQLLLCSTSWVIIRSDLIADIVDDVLEGDERLSTHDVWLRLSHMVSINKHPSDMTSYFIRSGLLRAVKKGLEPASSDAVRALALETLNSVADHGAVCDMITQDDDLMSLLVSVTAEPRSSEYGLVLMHALAIWAKLVRHGTEASVSSCAKWLGTPEFLMFFTDTLRFSEEKLYGPFGQALQSNVLEIIGRLASPSRIDEWRANPKTSAYLSHLEAAAPKLQEVIYMTAHTWLKTHNAQNVETGMLVAPKSAAENDLYFWLKHCTVILGLVSDDPQLTVKHDDGTRVLMPLVKEFQDGLTFTVDPFLDSANNIRVKYPRFHNVLTPFTDLQSLSPFLLFAGVWGAGRGMRLMTRHIRLLSYNASRGLLLDVSPLAFRFPWATRKDVFTPSLKLMDKESLGVIWGITWRTVAATWVLAPVVYDGIIRSERCLGITWYCDNSAQEMVISLCNVFLITAPVFIALRVGPYALFPTLLHLAFHGVLADDFEPVVVEW